MSDAKKENDLELVHEHLESMAKMHLNRLASFREMAVARNDFYISLDFLKQELMRIGGYQMQDDKIREAIDKIRAYPNILNDIEQAKGFIDWHVNQRRCERMIKRMDSEVRK